MFIDQRGHGGPPMGGHHQGQNAMLNTPQNQKYAAPYGANGQGYGSYRGMPNHAPFFEQQHAQFMDIDREHDPDFGMPGPLRHNDRSHEDVGRFAEMLKPTHLDDEDLQ